MTVLVTGGTGFIGAYVVQELLREKTDLVLYDAVPSKTLLTKVAGPLADKVPLVVGDITDLPHLLRTLRDHDVDRIVHLASLQIPASQENPARAILINSVGTVNVFESARILDIKRVVWASSIAVFGPQSEYGEKALGDDAYHRPQSIYGATKSLNEVYASQYFRDHGVDSIGLRPTAVYGYGRDRGKTSFTTQMIAAVAQDRAFTVPFADDEIDWQFVPDVASCFVQCLGSKPTKTRVFNTQGDVRPVKAAVDYLKKIEPKAQLATDKGIFGIAWRYDCSKYEKEVGRRRLTTMEDGIFTTLNVYREEAGKKPLARPTEVRRR